MRLFIISCLLFTASLAQTGCTDLPDWKDIDGDNCTWYDSCDDPGWQIFEIYHPKSYSELANADGISARDACCRCGRGIKNNFEIIRDYGCTHGIELMTGTDILHEECAEATRSNKNCTKYFMNDGAWCACIGKGDVCIPDPGDGYHLGFTEIKQNCLGGVTGDISCGPDNRDKLCLQEQPLCKNMTGVPGYSQSATGVCAFQGSTQGINMPTYNYKSTCDNISGSYMCKTSYTDPINFGNTTMCLCGSTDGSFCTANSGLNYCYNNACHSAPLFEIVNDGTRGCTSGLTESECRQYANFQKNVHDGFQVLQTANYASGCGHYLYMHDLFYVVSGSDTRECTDTIECICKVHAREVRLAGNYNEIITSDARKTEFLQKCSTAVGAEVDCINVRGGSVIVTLTSQNHTALDTSYNNVVANGLTVAGFQTLSTNNAFAFTISISAVISLVLM